MNETGALFMKHFYLLFLVVCVCVLQSCIPTKELTYLQNQEAALDSALVITEAQKT